MNTKRFISVQSAAARIMALVLVAVLALSAVTPAYAAGNTVASIGVSAPQSTALTYGTVGSTTYTVTVTSTGPTGVINVPLTIAGLPAGATASFNPASVKLTGIQSKTSVLTITTSSTTPANSWPFTVRNTKNTKTGLGTLVVGPALLDVAGTLAQDKVYDGTPNVTLNPACGGSITTNCAYLTGVLNSDPVVLVTVGAHGAFLVQDVGLQSVDVTGLSIGGIGASNYALPAPVVTTANISKATLTVTSNDAFMVSGGPVPAFGFTYSNFVGSEDGSVIDVAPSCNVPGSDYSLGTHAIDCQSASDNNYDFAYANTGILTVNSTNEPPTDIALSNQTIPAGQAAGFTVGSLTTTDADKHFGETYSYSLPSVGGHVCTDNSSFQIDGSISSNGPVPLLTNATLPVGSYNICIQTDDHNPAGTFVKDFAITVVETTASFTSTGLYDGWVLESGEFTGVGGTKNNGARTLRVGDDATNKQYRSILSFNTSILPDNAVISQITIKVMKQRFVGSSKIFTGLKGLLVDINKPSFGAVGLQLSDFKAKPSILTGMKLAGTFGVTPDSSGWYSVNLNPTAYQFINVAGTTQFRLRFAKDDNNNFKADYLSLFSGNALDPNTYPQLLITYTAP